MRIWRAARQSGKSTALAAECVWEAAFRGADCMIVSSAEKNAIEVLGKCRSMAEVARTAGVPLRFTVDAKTELRFANGHKILSLAQNPDTVRGFTGHVFLDEFAHHAEDKAIYQAILPVTTLGYRLSVISTPLGESGEFYRCWSERPDFSKHTLTIYDAIRAGLRADAEFFRRNMDEDAFRQEYLAEFVDEASSYFPYDLLRGNIGGGLPGGSVYMGVDVGRKRDRTVIYVLSQLKTMHTTEHIEVLEKTDFETQSAVIRGLWERFSAERLCIDASGIGAQLAEQLADELGNVEGVVFTNAVKEQMAITVKRLLQARRLSLPDDSQLLSDIHSIKKMVTASHNVRFDAERNSEGHADRFWALALACHACNDTAPAVRFL